MVANQYSPTSSGPNPNPPKVGQNLVSHTIACDYLNREESINVAELFDKLGSVKELAHDIAENYTWD